MLLVWSVYPRQVAKVGIVCVGGFSVAISRLGMVRYGSKTR